MNTSASSAGFGRLRRSAAIATIVAASASFVVAGAPAASAGTVWDATQVSGQPATFYWAVIVGINDYAAPTRDAVGSAQDAASLRAFLLGQGWRSDHIYMVTDRAATRDAIVTAIRWLAYKSTSRSAAVFSYGGHENHFKNIDSDSEPMDVALWGSDNRYLSDGALGAELSRVHAARMWLNFSVCRAAGFSDPGTIAPNRVATYSSAQSELSYEDGGLHHSVFGYFQIVQGMQNRQADRNKDGKVSVEEAYWYSRLPVQNFTSGRQHTQIVDKLSGDFSLKP